VSCFYSFLAYGQELNSQEPLLSESLNQCAVDICRLPEENLSWEEVLLPKEEIKNFEAVEEIKDMIKANKKSFLESEMTLLRSLEGEQREYVESLSKEDQALLIFFKKITPAVISLYMKGHASPSLLSSFIIFERDFKKIFIEDGMSEEEASWTADAINSLRLSFKSGDLYGVLFSKTPEYAITSYTGNSLYSNFRSLVEQVNLFFEDDKRFNSQLFDIFLRTIPKSYLNDIDSDKALRINTSFLIKELLKQIKKPESDEVKLFTNFLKSPPDFIITSMHTSWKTDFSKSKDNLELTEPEIDERFLKVLKNCGEKLNAGMSQLPTDREIKEIQAYIRKVRRRAIHFVQSKVSYSFAKSIDEQLSQVQFDLPLNRKNFKEKILTRLSFFRSGVYSFNELRLLSLVGVNDGLLESENFPFHRLASECEEYPSMSVLYDYSVSQEIINVPSLKISWSVLKNMDKLKGVIAHEFGHQLFSFLRGAIHSQKAHTKESYNNVRKIISCISSIHRGKAEEYTLYDENGNYTKIPITQYTNEDFADQFSALVEKDNNQNMACVFLKEKDGRYIENSMVNFDKEDVHSSAILRILNIENSKKKEISKSCIEVLKSSEIKMKSCLF